jgi:hypothetical protein
LLRLASSLTITGLNGDTDIIYLVYAKIMKDGTAAFPRMRVNSDSSSNYAWATFGYDRTGSGVGGSDSDTEIHLDKETSGEGVLANTPFNGVYHIFAKSGAGARRIIGDTVWRRSTAILTKRSLAAEWLDTTTNLTEIDFRSTSGNIGGAGTFIRVYRVTD